MLVSRENIEDPLLTKFTFPVALSSIAIETVEAPKPVKDISGIPEAFLLGVIIIFLFELDIRFQTSL
jgi:hypothetical protein